MAKLLTFDVTNTILRVAGSVGQQYAHVAKKFNVSLDVRSLNEAFKGVWLTHSRLYPNFGQAAGQSCQQWWAGVVEETFRFAGHSVSEQQLRPINEELYRYFMSAEPWEILPGSNEVLRKLKLLKESRPLCVGVISNTDSRLKTVLKNLELIDNFDFVLLSFECGSAKPDSAIFHKALELADVKPADAIHVGDHVTNDYHGARAIGMKALLLSKTGEIPAEVDHDHVIKSLDEIFHFLH
ncbi:haloacid dehalogenase-like hydrolase domain-containing protein 3 [Liolophura sinensis]|uniref:haloacid dehalogenase-like hydrolase domain-containing protein 3 n=1 Tax=Liolophura sinensis TaxID=3198878 RepID=UPI003158970B